MANYFVAGVGRALLFKGEQLFADCRTLADSSITIGVTAEDIRGGEGNVLFGQYFHDSSFSMKLTDIMFNLDYIAANTGAVKGQGGNIFEYDAIEYTGTPIELPAVPVVSGGIANVWYKLEGTQDEMKALAPNEAGKYAFPENGKFCIMYRKAVDGETISISSQFIPDALHAVLTVALYSGDNCNVETATKAGEVVVDIPRLQLSGAMDISMSATGAAQTPLEGNALASGCTGCDGKAVYATITKYIANAHWYDEAQGLVIEDMSSLVAPVVEKEVVAYAYYATKAPRKLNKNEWVLSVESGEGTVNDANKTFSYNKETEGTTVIKAVALNAEGAPITALDTNKAVHVAV